MRKRWITAFLLIAFTVLQAHGAKAVQPLPVTRPSTPVFVFAPTIIDRFKTNVALSIERYPHIKPYAKAAVKTLFDTANTALSETPKPFTNRCYPKSKKVGRALRNAGAEKDADYARTLALLLHVFPQLDQWSFELQTAQGPVRYRFARKQVLDTAKGYLLAWSRRMEQGDGMIPGVRQKGNACTEHEGNPDHGMNVAILAYSFVSAYELLFPYLNPNERNDFLRWMSALEAEIETGRRRWKENNFYNQPFNNHLSFQLLGLMSIAAAKADQTALRTLVDGPETGPGPSRHLKAMIDGAVFVESECSPAARSTNESCAVFQRQADLKTLDNELKRYPKITRLGCRRKHAYPKNHFPHTGEIYDRYRRVDKIKHSCNGKGMHYAMEHLKLLTVMTLAAELNGFPMKHYAGANGETLRSAYRFYAECLAEPGRKGTVAAAEGSPCGYYKNNQYPTRLVSAFHLAAELWNLDSTKIRRILNRDNQPLDPLNPLGQAVLLGLPPTICCIERSH